MSEQVIVESPAVQAPVVTPSILDPRVERGAAYLDEVAAGWAERMDLERFDLADCKCCVLGQIGWGHMPHDASSLSAQDAAWNTHGFHIEDRDDERRAAKYRVLEQDWRLAILSRRFDPVSAHTVDLWSTPRSSPGEAAEASDG